MTKPDFDLNRMIAIAIDLSAEKDFDTLMQKNTAGSYGSVSL